MPPAAHASSHGRVIPDTENVRGGSFNLIGTSRRNRDVWQRWASVIIVGSSGSLLLCRQGRIQYGLPSAAPAPVVYREGRACGCARGVGGAAASPERIPARLGTPPRARRPPAPSRDHMFLCNGFCCSPPLSCCFFGGEVHATLLLFPSLLRYHLGSYSATPVRLI